MTIHGKRFDKCYFCTICLFAIEKVQVGMTKRHALNVFFFEDVNIKIQNIARMSRVSFAPYIVIRALRHCMCMTCLHIIFVFLNGVRKYKR